MELIYFIATFEVGDYFVWKDFFDQATLKRVGAGIEILHIWRPRNEGDHLVFVLGRGDDYDDMYSVLYDHELSQEMVWAGVYDEPLIDFYTLERANEEAIGNDILLLMHEVHDYDDWRIEYESRVKERTSLGINEMFLLRDLEEENVVAIISKVPSLQAASRFLHHPGTEDMLENAGVISEPVAYILSA